MKSEILFLFEYKSVVVVVTWFDVAGLSEDFVMLTLFCNFPYSYNFVVFLLLKIGVQV
jgi:hypothetical protein